MYDFHYGSRDEILQNTEGFLVFVKRLLPRWINGIPDSECLAIFRSLDSLKNPAQGTQVLVETGCGASTLAMVLWSIVNDGHVYSWDINGSKGSFLRSVISEAICRPLGVDIYKYWTFIPFNSTNDQIGIPVLGELKQRASFGYFDSWHTLEHLKREIECFESVASNEFVIALDDAYYTKKIENYSYINVLRAKLGLLAVEEPSYNVCDPFYLVVDDYLRGKYEYVEKYVDSYKAEFRDDIFFVYYGDDRRVMNDLGMEQSASLANRFEAWVVKNGQTDK
jgi:hypothetical protein